jgi:hypothetical protein
MLAASIVGLVVIVPITRPANPDLEWARRTGPTGPVNLDSLVAYHEGFALLSGVTADGVLLWSSRDGDTWDHRPLQGSPSQLAVWGDRLFAYGVDAGRTLTRGDETWAEAAEIVFPDELRAGQRSGRPTLIADESGLIVTSILGDVWWSANGSAFDLVVSDPAWGPGQAVEVPFDSACRPPTRSSPDVPPMVTTDSGLAVLISSSPAEPFGIWPVCEPRLLSSADGRSWTGIDVDLGDGSYVYNMAWRDGRFIAVGGNGIGRPAAWTSVDGREWDQIDTLGAISGVDLYTVRAGPAGWVILGRDSQESNAIGWTSADGLCWSILPAEVDGADAAVSGDQIMILDRITYPGTWVAESTRGAGSC